MTPPDTDWLTGSFTGRGYWVDETGTRCGYRVDLEIANTASGFTVRFQHVFDDGDDTVDAAFELSWLAEPILSLSAGGAPLGKAYLLPGCFHYGFAAGETYVETTTSPGDDGLLIHGSSTRNKAGLYIAWREELQRR